MKNTLFSLLFLATLIICPTAGKAQVQKIRLFNFTWIISFFPNGEAWAQYGSTAGDCLYLKEGSVDFPALLNHINTAVQEPPRGDDGSYHISLPQKGQTECRSFALQDDSVIKHLLATLENKWTGFDGGPIGPRLEAIRKKYPIIPER